MIRREVQGDMASNINEEELATLTSFDRWMARHNGPDAISRVLLLVAIVLTSTGIYMRVIPVIMLALLVLLVALWRTLSTNIIKRRKEEAGMLSHSGFLRPWLANPGAAHAERKMYIHVKCPTCGQKARLPRGLGKVIVTCPSCGDQYIKKS